MNKGKIQKRWKQIIAAILAIAFTVTSIPYEGYTAKAEEVQPEQTVEASEISETKTEEKTQEADTYEVSEEEARFGENTETSTTFDVGNNKKMTVFYQEAVRYKDDEGQLIDYDPSLTEVAQETSENGEDLEGYVYENAEGDKKQYFPEELTEETPILLENEGYGISMNPAEELSEVQVTGCMPEKPA